MSGGDVWYRQLRWNATARGWIARTDELELFVSEHAYEQQVRAYFAQQGKTRKTYSEIMRVAEAEWQEQKDIEQALQQDIDSWLTCPVQGVSIRLRGETDEQRWARRREQEMKTRTHLLPDE